jgi:catechol 2,3-dioxygenase-like lactoylglutathione lyase family enzyme
MSRVAQRLLAAVLATASVGAAAQTPPGSAADGAAHAPPLQSTAAVLWQPSMNVFRRFDAPAEKMFEFYGEVLGFKQLSTINLGSGTGVARFQAGAQELKLTRRTPDRQYRPGGVEGATGLRLVTFFFGDADALGRRFAEHGLPAPKLEPVPGTNRTAALVTDPDGQAVELVIVPGASAEQLGAIEVGLTVADVERSRAFYRSFVGLEELPPVQDPRFGTAKYSFRHGATTISLRSFGRTLPADTGSGGIQYVVSDVDGVAALAAARNVTVEQPLSGLPGFALRTIWLNDPDGITNYFAETGQSREARAAAR